MNNPVAVLPFALGGPAGTGRIRSDPEDFLVDELLGFEPSGEGEHVFLRIEKRGENTEYIARQLARFAGVRTGDVSYAGLKDRHGRTCQWFSVQLPGKTGPVWQQLESATVRVLDVRRNNRKLRKGAASGNRFEITVRALTADRAELEARLGRIAERGVPNYFGAQRFGRDGQNLARALELFAGIGPRPDSHRRGLYLSAARSAFFNRILAERVVRGDWDQGIPGDVFMFADSRSFFKPDPASAEIAQRVAAKEIHPSGALWGRGQNPAAEEALAIETAVAAESSHLCQGLERCGLEMARRQLRVCPQDFRWSFKDEDSLVLRFELPAGSFATAVLRELVATDFSDD